MVRQGLPTEGCKKLHEFPPLLRSEAGAHSHMLQGARRVIQPQQQRTNLASLALLVPAESSHHAIAVALVLDLQHHALVRLVSILRGLCHHSVKTGALESA